MVSEASCFRSLATNPASATDAVGAIVFHRSKLLQYVFSICVLTPSIKPSAQLLPENRR